VRPQNKKHKYHAQTTKNTKNKNHKKEKQTTTTIIIIAVAINYYRIRVHYTVLTQHTTPTNNTHKNETQKRYHQADPAYTKG